MAEEGSSFSAAPVSSITLSCLDDDLLLRILSFLPTKLAVATALLSRRWERLLASMNRLSFSQFYFRDAIHFMKSVDLSLPDLTFPGRVLKLQSLDLVIDDLGSGLSHAETWIDRAAGREVEELYLRVLQGSEFDLPSRWFLIRSLRTLDLSLKVSKPFDWPLSCYLPSLEILRLEGLSFSSDIPEDDFKSCLPYLKSWTLRKCVGLRQLRVECRELQEFNLDHCPGLQSLFVTGDMLKKLSVVLSFSQNQGTTFVVTAINLEVLYWQDLFPHVFLFHQTVLPVNATLIMNRFPKDQHLSANLFLMIQRARHLTLSSCTLQLIKERRFDVDQALQGLQNLSLQLDLEFLDIVYLSFALRPFTEMKRLQITSTGQFRDPNYKFNEILRNLGSIAGSQYYLFHELHFNRLTEVNYLNFAGTDAEMELMMFLLGTVSSLQRVTISLVSTIRSEQRLVIVKKLKKLKILSSNIRLYVF